jgi:hypothetical protein
MKFAFPGGEANKKVALLAAKVDASTLIIVFVAARCFKIRYGKELV